MNNKFDELAKGLAQSVTRRQALKRFGVGLAGMALACFRLASKAEAGAGHCLAKCDNACKKLYPVGSFNYQDCVATCSLGCVGP